MRTEKKRCSILFKRAMFATWTLLLFVGCHTQSSGPDPVTAFDGRCEAPCPAEAVASLVDQVIDKHASNVTLALVRHPQPSLQSANGRAAWVCSVEGKPIWVIALAPRLLEGKGSGLTARALARAREFIAETKELSAKERPLNWKPKKEALLPAYQSVEYDLQITEIRLRDRDTESWEITAKPIRECLGGEIWMRFGKGHEVSAEFGR